MFIAINRLKIQPGSGSVLEERFAQSGGLEGSPGFIRFQLLRRSWQPHGEQDHEEYLAMTEWQSRDDFLAWTRSDAFKKAHSGPRLDIFTAPGEPAGYDIAVTREPETSGPAETAGPESPQAESGAEA